MLVISIAFGNFLAFFWDFLFRSSHSQHIAVTLLSKKIDNPVETCYNKASC